MRSGEWCWNAEPESISAAAMNFEWDATKSEACYQQRGLDSAYAARAFFDPNRIIRADTRHS
jgi:uncharacterized DUF497 family protein